MPRAPRADPTVAADALDPAAAPGHAPADPAVDLAASHAPDDLGSPPNSRAGSDDSRNPQGDPANSPDASPYSPTGASPAPPGRLVLIGTGHVFQIQDAIRDAVLALRPQAVFVELDHGRLRALQDRRAGRAPPTRGNWFQRRLQGFQENIANAYGAEAGGEMLAALEGASLVGARGYLIDRRVDITLHRALKQLTWRERLRAGGMFLGGGIRGLLPGRRRDTRAEVEKELTRYNQDPDAALDELARKFPTVRRVLIDERDHIMAARIRTVLATTPLGIAVVGDGHVPGMLRLLADLDVTAYRLEDARQGRLPKPAMAPGDGGTNRFSFGFEV